MAKRRKRKGLSGGEVLAVGVGLFALGALLNRLSDERDGKAAPAAEPEREVVKDVQVQVKPARKLLGYSGS